MTIPSHERQFVTAKENKSVRTGHIRLPALANDAHSRYMYMKDVLSGIPCPSWNPQIDLH